MPRAPICMAACLGAELSRHAQRQPGGHTPGPRLRCRQSLPRCVAAWAHAHGWAKFRTRSSLRQHPQQLHTWEREQACPPPSLQQLVGLPLLECPTNTALLADLFPCELTDPGLSRTGKIPNTPIQSVSRKAAPRNTHHSPW